MLQKAKENLATIVIVITIIGAVFAAFKHFASAEALEKSEQVILAEVKANKQRIEYKIVSDQILVIEERVFIIETRHNINVPGKTPIPMNTDTLETYHKLRNQLKRLYKEQEAALKGG